MPMLMPIRTCWPSMSKSSAAAAKQTLGQRFGRRRLLAVGRDDGELVAAEPGQERAAGRGLQALRHFDAAAVADRRDRTRR